MNKSQISKIIISSFLPLICYTSFSQPIQNADSTSKRPAAAGLKKYDEVVTKRAKTSLGFFKVHQIDDRYYFEIPKSLLRRQMLVQSRISKGPVDPNILDPMPGSFGIHKTGNSSDKITENIIEFSTGSKNKLFINVGYYGEQSSDFSENGLGKAVADNSLFPYAASFDIRAYSKDSSAIVVDFTDFINGDNPLLFFNSAAKRQFNITSISPDRSFTTGVTSSNSNIEISTIKTYKNTESFNTYELTTNLLLLPANKMRVRYADKRVAYFTTSIQDFDINPLGVDETNFIHKWRIEPKSEEIQKYKRGELVEPVKPIIIYIDPLAPKKWVPYFIAGVNAWQKAFEKAGFKNAIFAREAPGNDPSFSIESSNISAIVYRPAAVPDTREQKSYTVNPQTGEILETHIVWNHAQMESLYLDYFLQCSNQDPRARSSNFNDSLMGSLIQARITHLVGHSLGLTHNYCASSLVDVSKLRNNEWLAQHSMSPSIMDVLSYNYVAQPEDKIKTEHLLPSVGEYDLWAIEYGYRLFPEAKTPLDEMPILNKWIIEHLRNNPYLNKGTSSATDPRIQSNDLGNDITRSNYYGIQNLKAIFPHLLTWTSEHGRGYTQFNYVYRGLYKQYFTYILHAVPSIGGFLINSKTIEQEGSVFTFIPRNEQKAALAFINDHFFKTQSWLYNKRYYELSAGYPSLNDLTRLQNSLFTDLLDNERLYHLEINNLQNSEKYQLNDFFTDLNNFVFDELKSKAKIDQYRRSLQKVYITTLCNKITPGASIPLGPGLPSTSLNISNTTEGYLAIKTNLRILKNQIDGSKNTISDLASRVHLTDISDRIAVALKASKE